MDTTIFSEGQYVTAEVVKSSPTKLAVVLDEALPQKTDYGESLQCRVNIDGKIKVWRLNRDSVKNMQALGVDSNTWVGSKVQLMVMTVKGKEQIIGMPIPASA
jgi:hypothetical protein